MEAQMLAVTAQAPAEPKPAATDAEHRAPPELTAPVKSGPVVLAGVGGVPILAIAEATNHISGRRLADHVMDALGQAGLAIELPR